MIRELGPGEEHLAEQALLALRPQWGGRLVERCRAQRVGGYRILAAFAEGDEQAAAAAGFRVGENLAWGRFLYVDDLSTRPEHRGRGHGAALLRALGGVAEGEGCDELHLDSGVGPDRQDAHRLYFNARLRIASHHFARPLR